MLDNDVQLAKAIEPIVVKEVAFVKSMLVKFVQPLNALAAMVLHVFPTEKTIDVIVKSPE